MAGGRMGGSWRRLLRSLGVLVVGVITACAATQAESTTPESDAITRGVASEEVVAFEARFEAWSAAPAEARDVAELEALGKGLLGLETCEGECVSFVLQVGSALASMAEVLRSEGSARSTSLIEIKLRTEMMLGIHELTMRTAAEIIDARGDLELARRALQEALDWEAGLVFDQAISARFSAAAFEKHRSHHRGMAHAYLASVAIAESRFADAIVELDAAAMSGHRSLRSHQERARAMSALAGGVPEAAVRHGAADACFADFVDQPKCLELFDVKTAESPPDQARRAAAIAVARRRVLEEDTPTSDGLRASRPAQAYAERHELDDRPTLVAVASKYCKPCEDEPEELAEVAAACPGARLLLIWETDDGEAPSAAADNLEIVAVEEAASEPPTGYPHHAVFLDGEVAYTGSGASLDGWWRFMFELEAAGATCTVPDDPRPSGRTGWGTHASSG